MPGDSLPAAFKQLELFWVYISELLFLSVLFFTVYFYY